MINDKSWWWFIWNSFSPWIFMINLINSWNFISMNFYPFLSSSYSVKQYFQFLKINQNAQITMEKKDPLMREKEKVFSLSFWEKLLIQFQVLKVLSGRLTNNIILGSSIINVIIIILMYIIIEIFMKFALIQFPYLGKVINLNCLS